MFFKLLKRGDNIGVSIVSSSVDVRDLYRSENSIGDKEYNERRQMFDDTERVKEPMTLEEIFFRVEFYQHVDTTVDQNELVGEHSNQRFDHYRFNISLDATIPDLVVDQETQILKINDEYEDPLESGYNGMSVFVKTISKANKRLHVTLKR